MPVKQGPEGVHQEMKKFKAGELHSGSKTGPKVTNRKQAIAIALSEAGMSRKKKKDGGAVEKKHGGAIARRRLDRKQGGGRLKPEDVEGFARPGSPATTLEQVTRIPPKTQDAAKRQAIEKFGERYRRGGRKK